MTSFSWNGSDANWNTPLDWNPNGPPGVGDDVTIASGGAVLVTAPISAASITITNGSLEFVNAGPGQSSISGSLSNNGGILQVDFSGVEGGSDVAIGGTLINSAGFLEIGNSNLSSTTTVTAGGLNNTAVIELYGGTSTQASLDINTAAGFGTAGDLTGNVELQGDTLIEFKSGQITDIASTGYLTLDGSTAFIADAPPPSSNLTGDSALQGLSTIEGTFDLRGGFLQTTGGLALANSGTLLIDENYDFGDGHSGGSSVTLGGTLTNSGNIYVGDATLTTATTVTASGLDNTGSLTLKGASAQATLDVTGPAGFGTAGELTGNVYVGGNALIEFTSGQITDIASTASLILDGSTAFIADAPPPGSNLTGDSALQGLSTIEGTFDLRGGVLQTTGGLTNGGNNLGIDDYDNGHSGGSSVTIGGMLMNSGKTYIGNTALATATTVTASGLDNTGELQLSGSSTLAASSRSTGRVESRGGIAPPRAPRTVREPLNSHGSRCSAVAMT